MSRKLVVILLATALYAVTRYVGFGDVSAEQIPVYVLNKSVAMAATVFLVLAAWHRRRGEDEQSRWWGTAFTHAVVIHVLMSIALLSAVYYPGFFGNERMTLWGEVSIMSGVLGAYGLWASRRDGLDVRGRARWQVLALLFVASHLLTMGWSDWRPIRAWPGHLPPISLASFLLVGTTLVLLSNSGGEP